ncbi:hypothetical protein OG579_03835 [Williamsia herbipolensis]|uniref:Uncharacterized protein n=1 Tax=Williamsia herbipolensis TaxID=1603258 RepID=A0AAU4K4G6_9NOCA|nr:hypothetical protein [Williamsia herbipolensis]
MIKVTPKPGGYQIRSGAFYVYVPHAEVARVVDELTRNRFPKPHDPDTHIPASHPVTDAPRRELDPCPDYLGFLAARQAEWAAFHERAAQWEAEHSVGVA